MATVVQSEVAYFDDNGPEIVIGYDDRSTAVQSYGVDLWASGTPLHGPNGNAWVRNTNDLFYAADLDGDGYEEILIACNSSRWTGVLKWQNRALQPIWMSPSPLTSPTAGAWNRGPDTFLAVDLDGDGRKEILVANNQDKWTGVLKWTGAKLEPIWMSPSPLHGPAGQWNRRDDSFEIVDFQGSNAIGVNAIDGWYGILVWQHGELEPVSIIRH